MYLYIVCKNLGKFNVKIIFYYTSKKHKFLWQHRLHVQLSPMKQCDHSSIKSVQNVLCMLSHTHTQTSSPLSNCSADDLKSWPLLHESHDEVVDVTDLHAVDHLLNVNISMTAALIFTNIGSFVEKVQLFMPLNCNCAKLTICWRFSNMFMGSFFRVHGVCW